MVITRSYIYVYFVDFKKAFDTVIHSGIKYKLLQNNINGMFYRILCDMNKNNYLSVKLDSKFTQPFKSDIGVRQGVVLIPNIFKFFLNDLNISIESSGIGTTLFNTNIGCLLYADDLVLISDSKNGLQKQLNILNECLSVNISKTKVIIFNKTGKLVQDIFHIENQVIECATSYKYIGIMLQASEKFNQARKMMYNKALKGMFKIRKDLSNLNPYINTLLYLYEHTIQPIAIMVESYGD